MKNSSFLLSLLSVLFICSNVFGGSRPSPEKYSDRPSILDVKPTKNHNLTSTERSIFEGMIKAAVLMAKKYDKNTHFYFLARDAEYSYDIALFLAETKYPKLKERLHLINVSTALSFDPALPSYLSQVGINNEFFKKGGSAIFVETGFMGTVPEMIKLHYPQKRWSKLGLILFESRSDKFSSFDLFQSDAAQLEDFPHYTDTAISFVVNQEGFLDPISLPQTKSERKNSLNIMRKLKSFLQSDDVNRLINQVEDLLARENYDDYVNGDLLSYQVNDRSAHTDFLDLFDSKKGLQKRLKRFTEQTSNWQSVMLKKIPKVMQKHGLDGVLPIVEIVLDKNMIGYDDYAQYEAFVLSLLPVVLATNDSKLVARILERAIKYEAEEALEKLAWTITRRNDIEKFDKYFATIIERMDELFDSSTIILKIIYENIVLSELKMPKTIKKFSALSDEMISDKVALIMTAAQGSYEMMDTRQNSCRLILDGL